MTVIKLEMKEHSCMCGKPCLERDNDFKIMREIALQVWMDEDYFYENTAKGSKWTSLDQEFERMKKAGHTSRSAEGEE